MKRPPRFAITRALIQDSFARVIGKELHHLRDVARLRAGAEICLTDETGIEYIGSIEQLTPDYASIALRKAQSASPARRKILLAAALIKGPRMDFVVEKAAELGAAELLPLICSRCVPNRVGTERLERWRRVALAAAKQSLAPRMDIRPPIALTEMIRERSEQAVAIFCAPNGDALAKIVRDEQASEILMTCGPEGDFTPHEIALMRDAGFRAASLGPNRLRSETAALAALSIVTGALDETRDKSD
jgi:16S rRNA (uracil1498-N3)-methyltransferase